MGVSSLVTTGGVTQRTTDFTSSGTWVCPAGVYSAEFLVVGAGGGGGGADNSVNTATGCGGGGGGGAVVKQTLSTTPGNSYTITVGAKGTGGNATAGTSGGYSEIVLSGTTLLKAFGGAGGEGKDATDTVLRVAYGSYSGGGGEAASSPSDSTIQSGGGGGAGFGVYQVNSTRLNVSTSTVQGVQGSASGSDTTSQGAINILGMYGIDNFGSGGNGSMADNAGLGDYQVLSMNNFGTAAIVTRTTAGATNGGSATYYGCGGGGAISMLSTDAATGGDGADGLVRITYFA
jgi:hypothetical protein